MKLERLPDTVVNDWLGRIAKAKLGEGKSSVGQIDVAGRTVTAPEDLQWVADDHPLIAAGNGKAILTELDDEPFYILTDPDLINNAALKDPQKAAAALDMWRSSDTSVVTEYRPGTYIYLDRYQVAKGVGTLDDCALTVLATVVSHPTATRAILDAGSKALSSDTLGLKDFGELLGAPDARVTGLSEEHDAHGDALLEILRCGEAHIEADRKDERGDRRQP